MSRLARMCKQHDRVLEDRGDQVWCPIGHWAASWKVMDRVTGKETEGGEEGETAATPPGVKVTNLNTGKYAQPQPTPVQRVEEDAPSKAKGQLRTARYLSAVGAVLRLVLTKLANDRYRVLWIRHESTDKRAKQERGCISDTAAWQKAREDFAAACADAEARGWKESGGTSRLKFLPIPDADPGAAPKKDLATRFHRGRARA